MSGLEGLEGRVVLSNVTAIFNPLNGVLTVAGDEFTNSIKITEQSRASGARVIVASGALATTINGTSVPFTTPAAVLAINVTYQGAGVSTISLTGPGKAVATTVKNVSILPQAGTFAKALNVSVSNVVNTGTFTLIAHDRLTATMDSSTFNTVDIEQDGTKQGSVSLTNDVASGAVRVYEGYGDGSGIIVDRCKFGSTDLEQNVGPAGSSAGNNDAITVTRSTVKDLTVVQGDGGLAEKTKPDSIVIDTVQVSQASFGVVTSQGGGNGDTTTINAVGTTIPKVPGNLPGITPGVSSRQGNGNGVTTRVSGTVLPGDIAVKQGSGKSNYAEISGCTAGFTYTDSTGTVAYRGSVSIEQGGGKGDVAALDTDIANDVWIVQGDGGGAWAMVMGVTVRSGGIAITQGAGDGDGALVSDCTAGTIVPAGPFVIPGGGAVTITQGNGYHDRAVVDGSTINTLTINQGNNIVPPDGGSVVGDEIHVNGSAITGELSLVQGTAAATGLSTVDLGDSSPVAVGGATTIIQHGEDNSVVLGSEFSSFFTRTLDIYTGDGGTGFVMAMNATVIDGSSLNNDFVIDGGWDPTLDPYPTNTYVDLGGNDGVTASGNYNFG